MSRRRPLALIRGGGDLATGVAARLQRSGFSIVVTEIERPLALRRLVALAEAVYSGTVEIEGLLGRKVDKIEAVKLAIEQGEIPVRVDPEAASRHELDVDALVDARMLKSAPEVGINAAPLVVGLGPGFTAGMDCHAVVETQRGHYLGRVLWKGRALADTGVPEPVRGLDLDRVLRAPVSGTLRGGRALGSIVDEGEILAMIDETPLRAPFRGALRGLVHDGLAVEAGAKIGDLDPRAIATFCYEISDKALAVGGGVLEALLSSPSIRARLGS